MSNAAHIDQIMAIMDAAFDPQWGEAWNRRQVEDALVMPTTYAILADPNGEDATSPGFVISRYAPGEEELLLIAVDPKFRRQGIAHRLLEQLASNARERGAERLFLEMRRNNPAVSLYSKIGFEPIGMRKNYYLLSDGSRMDAITYGLSI